MKVYVSGGCKNGKSHYAQRLARSQAQEVVRSQAQEQKLPQPQELAHAQNFTQARSQARPPRAGNAALYYIATMSPSDAEDDERIARHRSDRDGQGFTTVEQPADIDGILDKCDAGGSFLIDSVTALLANEMFLPDGTINGGAADKIIGGLTRILNCADNVVIVSDYIFGDAELYDPLVELYRESLAKIDRAAARLCDSVVEIAYANVICHKQTNKQSEGRLLS